MDLRAQIAICTNILSKYEKTGFIDLENISFLCPAILLPISLAAIKDPNKILKPKDILARDYFDTVINNFNNPRFIKDTTQPIAVLPRDHDKDIINKIQNKIRSFFNSGLQDPVSYLLSEMIANIYDHSKHKNAFVMAQKYPKMNVVDFCIMDDGITIPICYKNYGHKIEEDTDAIKMVFQGISTKREGGRGFGLRKTAQMLVDGFKAEYLLFSGNGGVIMSGENKTLISSKNIYRLGGTLIACQLKTNQDKIDIAKYYDP